LMCYPHSENHELSSSIFDWYIFVWFTHWWTIEWSIPNEPARSLLENCAGSPKARLTLRLSEGSPYAIDATDLIGALKQNLSLCIYFKVLLPCIFFHSFQSSIFRSGLSNEDWTNRNHWSRWVNQIISPRKIAGDNHRDTRDPHPAHHTRKRIRYFTQFRSSRASFSSISQPPEPNETNNHWALGRSPWTLHTWKFECRNGFSRTRNHGIDFFCIRDWTSRRFLSQTRSNCRGVFNASPTWAT
jgi:hypothetical protein